MDLQEIDQLINDDQLDKAQLELSKLGSKFHRNAEYLFLRSRVFYLKDLHYMAIDTLLIALEFGEDEKIFVLLSEIYSIVLHTNSYLLSSTGIFISIFFLK